jgi:hypothetical protein
MRLIFKRYSHPDVVASFFWYILEYMEQTRVSKRQRPLSLTLIIGYFIIVWALMLWTMLYVGVTGKQSFATIITNVRWFNIKVFSICGFLVLVANIASVYGIFKMKKWGVYLLLATIVAAILANLYSAPDVVFSNIGLFLKMFIDLIALYVIVPVVAVVIAFKHVKFMK